MESQVLRSYIEQNNTVNLSQKTKQTFKNRYRFQEGIDIRICRPIKILDSQCWNSYDNNCGVHPKQVKMITYDSI